MPFTKYKTFGNEDDNDSINKNESNESSNKDFSNKNESNESSNRRSTMTSNSKIQRARRSAVRKARHRRNSAPDSWSGRERRAFLRQNTVIDFERNVLRPHHGGDFDDEETPLLLMGAPPKDAAKFVCLSFCYLGMSTMLPWNFLISVTSFWDYKFRNVTLDPQPLPLSGGVTPDTPDYDFVGDEKPTAMQLSFPSYLAIASNVPGFMTTLAHSLFGQRVSVATRVFWSLSVLLASFVALLTLSLPNCDQWQQHFLHVSLLIVVLTNVGVNVLQGALFGVSGRFPPVYAGCVMTGQALGGVIPAAAAIALTVADVRPKILGPSCFAAIIACVIAAIILFYKVSSNDFFLFYGEGIKPTSNIEDNNNEHVDHDAEADSVSYKRILKRSWAYIVVGYVTFTTSLCVFPAITTLVESQTHSSWSRRFFTPVCSVLLFNLGDLCGRSLATALRWPGRSKAGRAGLLVFAILRIGLIPAFMFCNAAPESRTLPVLIHSDVLFCCLVAFTAFSTGYVGNLCLIQAPKTSPVPSDQEATSLVLTAFFVFGQASGSFASIFMVQSL